MGGYRFGSYKTELVFGLRSYALDVYLITEHPRPKTKDPRPTAPSFPHRHCSIQIQIKLQHVYSWLAQKAELSALCMSRYDLSYLFLTDAAFASNPGYLKFSPGGRNVRVKAGP